MHGSPVDQTIQISEGETWVRWICSGTDGLCPAGRAMRASVRGRKMLLGYSGKGPVRDGGGGLAGGGLSGLGGGELGGGERRGGELGGGGLGDGGGGLEGGGLEGGGLAAGGGIILFLRAPHREAQRAK